jgi:hypothetical protein
MSDTISLLSAPFPPDAVKWKAGKVTADGTKTLGMAYVDARDVMDRLDHAFGPQGWEDFYTVISTEGAVQCTLAVTFTEEDAAGTKFYRRVTKQDVGYPNGKADEEPLKSAFSDALKRTCVKLGIGRDLYDIEPVWLPYDKDKRRITGYPAYVAGKGWLVPQNANVPHAVEQAPARNSPPSGPRLATDAMRKKVFATATNPPPEGKGKTKEELKAIGQAVTGKDSSTLWTTEDIDKVLSFLEELA